MKTACILGGNGFIGHHMARRLKSQGYWVRVVDINKYEYGDNDYADEIVIADLRDFERVKSVVRLTESLSYSFLPQPFEKQIEFDEIFNFACLMGGAGFVFTGEHDAEIMHDSALINLNVAEAVKKFKGKIFYSSSACMYPQELQDGSDRIVDYDVEKFNPSLKESDAYPANPDSEYGWEKLFSERLYLAYARNYGLNVRIARFHNIYGPEGTYKGGKEKAPAAMCRKVIEATDHIEIWGDGKQTRSFLYIDDCLDAIQLLMSSDFKEPINIGSEEMVRINELAYLAISLSGKSIAMKNVDGPTGVRGRNSDNTLIKKVLNWEPKFSLKNGLERTFMWIKSEME